jgi:integrase
MEIADLRKEPIIIEWFQTANIKPRSVVSYIQGMRDFTEYTKKNPETLLEDAENEVRAGKLMRQRALKRQLVGFRQHLQNEGKAPMTIKNRMVGVKSFFETFDIEIPKLPRVGKAVTLEKNNDIPSKEDIQDVLKVADPLEKAIVLTGVSSGLAANEISNLKVKDFQKGYNPKTGITTLKLRREKTSFDFITFLSPEASRAILDYLDYRNRSTNNPRQIDMLKKQKVYSDNDYLFIRRQVIPEYLDKPDENSRRLDTESITKVYRILSTKARKNTPLNEWSFIRSHNLRKYFNSTLLNAGADSFFTNFLMGHTLNETQAAYFRASPEKLKEIYFKFVPYLTIQKEADISESPEYQRIKQENQILQAETARHIVDRSELQELRDEIEQMKEASTAVGSIKREYLHNADLHKILEMKDQLHKELEEISKLKEIIIKARK